MKHLFVVAMETDKPILDAHDKIAQRIYTLDGRKGDVVVTDFAVFVDDLRKRVDVQPLEVHDTITWEPKVVIGGITLPWTP